jgi:hypothetical protein
MAVKKLRRRKKTRGRQFAGVVKAFRSTGTTGVSVAIASAVLALLLVFAYSTSPPSAQTGERPAAPAEKAQPAAPRERTATAPALARKEAPAVPEASAAEEERAEDGVTTGPMPTVVTLTGCLARSDKEFRLTDTTGVNAPKSRSWKSGFLAKRSASVSIVPASGDLPLSRHVGRRVAVSGTLIDREMRVRTLRRVSDSCDEDSTAVRVTA